MMGKVKKVTSNHLFLPLFALALLLVGEGLRKALNPRKR